MTSILAALVLSIIPPRFVVRESVDSIQTNHFYDDEGRLVFDQIMFRRWYTPNGSTYWPHVIAWRLVKNPETQVPRKDWEQGGYTILWDDGGVIREVRAPSVSEDWTQYDPELLERERLPKESRPELKAPYVVPPKRSSVNGNR